MLENEGGLVAGVCEFQEGIDHAYTCGYLLDRLRANERLVVRRHDGGAVELRRGRLTHLWSPPAAVEGQLEGMASLPRPVEAVPPDPGPPEAGPLPTDLADELLCVARWLDRHAPALVMERASGEWASPLPPLPRFSPVGR